MSNYSSQLNSLLSRDAQLLIEEAVWLETVDSTQAYLQRYLTQNGSVSNHGAYVCLTEYQYQGRGQRGSSWEAEPGQSVLFSIAYPIKQITQWAGISLAACVEACQVLASYAAGIQVKWPNDIVYNNAKLGGILVDSIKVSPESGWLIMGLGLNISKAPLVDGSVSQCLADVVHDKIPERSVIIASLIEAWLKLIQDYPQHGFADWQLAFHNIDRLYGKTISVQQHDRIFRGQALGVDQYGCLQLCLQDNQVCSIASGHIVKE